MNYSIWTVPQEFQRYDTLGDWQFMEKNYPLSEICQIKVSNLNNEDSEFLIAIHEMIEAYLSRRAGITGEQVDKWDWEFLGDGEPGEHPDCPYRMQHLIADIIEKSLCLFLHILWQEHEARCNAILEKEKPECPKDPKESNESEK